MNNKYAKSQSEYILITFLGISYDLRVYYNNISFTEFTYFLMNILRSHMLFSTFVS